MTVSFHKSKAMTTMMAMMALVTMLSSLPVTPAHASNPSTPRTSRFRSSGRASPKSSKSHSTLKPLKYNDSIHELHELDGVDGLNGLETRGGAVSPKYMTVKGKAPSGASSSTSSTSSGGKKMMKKKKKMVKKRIVKTSGSAVSAGKLPLPTSPNTPNETSASIASSSAANNNSNNVNPASANAASSVMDTMPSIFRIPSEEKYDRYAAALAVTEGLRRVRDAEVERAEEWLQGMGKKKQKRPFWGMGGVGKVGNVGTVGNVGKVGKVGTSATIVQNEDDNNENKEQMTPQQELTLRKQRAESAFLLQSTKAVEALGMTVAQFNQIGREVLKDKALKERVSEQAYLYRIATAINLDRVPPLQSPSSPLTQSLLPSHRRYRVQMFARSITEIEDLRLDQMEALRQSLHMERSAQFPPGFDLSDPNVQPLLHPRVRKACEAFPKQAEEIVKRYGLESDEFNAMLEETKGNPIFRWRVKKYVEKAEEERMKEKEMEMEMEMGGRSRMSGEGGQ